MVKEFDYRVYRIRYKVGKDGVAFNIYIWDSEGLRYHWIMGDFYAHPADTATEIWAFKRYAMRVADGINFKS